VVFPACLCVTQCAIASCVDIFCYVSHPTKSRQEAGKPQNRTRVWLGVRVTVRHKIKHQRKLNRCITLNRCYYCARFFIEPQIVTTSIWHRSSDTIIAAFVVVSLVRAVHLGDIVSAAAAAAATSLHEMTHVSSLSRASVQVEVPQDWQGKRIQKKFQS
jgi:hypothetical protein